MKKYLSLPFVFFALLIVCSCSKGYEVRVTNYYLEAMDTVLVGNNLVFTDLARQGTTEYKPIAKGTYNLTFITKSKFQINSTITLPSKKSGKRTIQVDGQGNVLVLKD